MEHSSLNFEVFIAVKIPTGYALLRCHICSVVGGTNDSEKHTDP